MTCVNCSKLKRVIENSIRFHSGESSPDASSIWEAIHKTIPEDDANKAWHHISSIVLQGLYQDVYGQEKFMEFIKEERKRLSNDLCNWTT